MASVLFDIMPLPQNDSENPVVRIKYTPAFEEAMGRFRALLVRGELGERGLQVTADVIEVNAANYTAWAYRRRCLEDIGSREVWERELAWSGEITQANQKNYQVWFHRRRCVEVLATGDAAELEFIAECLEEDAKNYHAWGYRQWLLRHFQLWTDELGFTASLVKEDPHNNSAWNQRFFVFKETGALADAGAVALELEYAQAQLRRDPHNSAPWNYIKGLVEAAPKELLLKKGAGAAALTVDGADAEIWLTAYCRSVLAAQVGCVPAAGVLVDLCEKRGSAETLTEGAALCLALATKWDTIRSKYWAMRQAQLSSSAAA